MKVLPLVFGLLILLTGCSNTDEQAALFCKDSEGIKGYQDRYGFPVVVCNNGNRGIIE